MGRLAKVLVRLGVVTTALSVPLPPQPTFKSTKARVPSRAEPTRPCRPIADLLGAQSPPMPTVFTHTAVPLAIGIGLGMGVVSPRLFLAGVIASIAPDLDVTGFRFGIAYSDIEGHRGLLHSLAFALLLALLAACVAGPLRSIRGRAFAFVLASAASHGLLDMLTNGGLGVAYFWPLSEARHFFAWHPIKVSPLSLHRLQGAVGQAVMASELRFVWLPALGLCLSLWIGRRARSAAGAVGARRIQA